MRTYNKRQDLWNRLKYAALLIALLSLLKFASSCSSARMQTFKELNQPQTSNHYRDTVINDQKIRIPVPQKRTEAQIRKDRRGVLIAVGVLAVWYVSFQTFGEHE